MYIAAVNFLDGSENERYCSPHMALAQAHFYFLVCFSAVLYTHFEMGGSAIYAHAIWEAW